VNRKRTKFRSARDEGRQPAQLCGEMVKAGNELYKRCNGPGIRRTAQAPVFVLLMRPGDQRHAFSKSQAPHSFEDYDDAVISIKDSSLKRVR